MAITFYSELQAAIASFLNRSDLTAAIPDFIVLAEARFNRDLRDWLTSYRSQNAVTGDVIMAGVDGDVVSVSYNDGPGGTFNHPLIGATQEEYRHLLARNSAVRSPATHVFVEYSNALPLTTLKFHPPPSAGSPISSLRIEVVNKLESLSSATTTNRLLIEAPDVYLYGSLAESAPYLQHDERLPIWEARATAGIKELILQTERRKQSVMPRRMRLPVVF